MLTYRYNRTLNRAESIVINEDCEVDASEKWNYNINKWELDEVLWESARPISPPPPKPPGFWAKLWAKLTRRHALPQARLLKD